MRNPHIAAYGYTYEAEFTKGWLHSGRSTSPMTKLPLAHHHLIMLFILPYRNISSSTSYDYNFFHEHALACVSLRGRELHDTTTIAIGYFHFRGLAWGWWINALREEKMRRTNPAPIGPFNFSFVIFMILAVNCTFVHKSIVLGTEVFQVQSAFIRFHV